jgi:hypothetical protein
VAVKSQLEAAKGQIDAVQKDNETAQVLIGAMTQERDAIRHRVDRLLKQMDELL